MTPRSLWSQRGYIIVDVYFIDEQAQYIVGESREISGRNEEELAADAFDELISGPKNQNLYNLIPEGTEIINTEYIDNYIFLNLSSEFVDKRTDDGLVDYLVINCIAATMTEIPGVRGVLFKVDWEKIDVYGTLDVKNPVTRNEELIK
jgi:spore germination protein GerM